MRAVVVASSPTIAKQLCEALRCLAKASSGLACSLATQGAAAAVDVLRRSQQLAPLITAEATRAFNILRPSPWWLKPSLPIVFTGVT